MPELAYVNGKIMPIEEAYVPIEDRGYQFGDAVYEFLASYGGRIFAMEEHLDRLERSLKALAFDRLPRNVIRDAIAETFHQAGYERAGIYLQVSRGVAPRNHAFPRHAQPQVIITVREAPILAPGLYANGASAITLKDIRWQRCDIKTVQLLPNTWAKQQAMDAGADDAIFVANDGAVREATSANVFIATQGALITHPLTDNILPGITRAHIIDLCKEQGILVHQKYFDQSEMIAADEVFLTGTVTEVLPVVNINGQSIGDGIPGTIAPILLEGLRELAGA